LFHQHLQLVELGVVGCNMTRQWQFV
jgi:hypothetical protein